MEGTPITLGAGIGAALYPINAESGEILFRAADSALSKAKTIGRDALAMFDTEMKEKMQRNASLLCASHHSTANRMRPSVAAS